ncbi:MAG: DUF938 domain-containing protein [Myxococcales bacterium]|nr:DUF938 domain-containing protein [Myxococcales bacterium]
MSDPRLHAPATTRNRDPILEVLREVLPPEGDVLEVASGSGEHAVHFAAALAPLRWIPTDVDEAALASIAAYVREAQLPNLAAPRRLDLLAPEWPTSRVDALVAINVIHISPWEATVGLFDGAARLLPPGAPLVTYGPYAVDGAHTAPSNAAFDASLRARDPQWGVRDVTELEALARPRGLSLERRVPMPANNLTLIFRRQPIG